MECFYCKGDMTDGTTTYVADVGNCIIIIKNVPCVKCKQCGEVAYTGDVAQQLEYIVNSVRNTPSEIVLLNYTDKAA